MFSFIRFTTVMASFHSNRTLTKTHGKWGGGKFRREEEDAEEDELQGGVWGAACSWRLLLLISAHFNLEAGLTL